MAYTKSLQRKEKMLKREEFRSSLLTLDLNEDNL